MNKETMEKLKLMPGIIYRIHPDELETLKDIAILMGKEGKPLMNPTGVFRYLINNTPTGKTVPMASFTEEGKIQTCIIITHHFDDMMKKILWIDFAWKDPKAPEELNTQAMEYVNDIALRYGAKHIRTQMVRGHKAVMKKYNFTYVATILEKEVKKNEKPVKKDTKKDK